ncbi:MAG: DEAD/DEAH box helicase [Sulfolobales archaeon]|nr:DEAD/DEAH box helicase [Sulfolobales archaeon]MDW7968966.1 DEAD/DEAH box helicase [Sulfolobales archaeon]
MINSYVVKTRKWLDDDEFKEVLSIADYLGRDEGASAFNLNLNKILKNGYDVDDVVDILEKYDFIYSNGLIESLTQRIARRDETVVELSIKNGVIFMHPNKYLGNIYDKMRNYVTYDRKERAFKVVPFYLFTVIKFLTDLGVKVVNRTELKETQPLPMKLEFRGELRDYQREAINNWSSNNYRGIIALPTGSGKTIIGIAAITSLNERTLIVAYTKDQLTQWRESILRFTNTQTGLIGMYYSEEKRIAPITLTTYQTAFKYISDLMRSFTFLLIDEVHHLPAEKFMHIALNSPAPHRMGLSATPYREDGRHVVLFPLMGGVVYYKTPAELSEKGFLAPYEVITVYVKLTQDERKKYLELIKRYRALVGSSKFEDVLNAAKNGNPAALEALKIHTSIKLLVQKSKNKVNKAKEIIESELIKGNKIIVFAHYVDLAEEIANTVGALLLTGDVDKGRRDQILSKFKQLRSGVLVVTTVGDEGLDIPDASIGILVAGTGSRRQFIQRLGRLLRPKEGKRAVLYEIIVKGTSEELQSKRRKNTDIDIENQHE